MSPDERERVAAAYAQLHSTTLEHARVIVERKFPRIRTMRYRVGPSPEEFAMVDAAVREAERSKGSVR